jgi:hypothetical protein
VSESDPSGYQDSPDTVHGGATGEDEASATGQEAPLTTDDEAQRDDSVARPGNEPD